MRAWLNVGVVFVLTFLGTVVICAFTLGETIEGLQDQLSVCQQTSAAAEVVR